MMIMKKRKMAFAIIFAIFIFALSACGSDDSRFVGNWTGRTGGTAWLYEFNRDGTGTWGDGRNAASDLVWDTDLGRYVTVWNYHVRPTTWNISGDTLEITLINENQVFLYQFEFLDNDTLVLTREGWPTGLELMRVE